MSKRASLVSRNQNFPVDAPVGKFEPEKAADKRRAIARMVERAFLVFVGSIVVALILAQMERGLIGLIKRVDELLAIGR
jgi:hypothetical protein